jgi:hypothetical protein
MRDYRRIDPGDASCRFSTGRAATSCVVRFLRHLNNCTQKANVADLKNDE